MCSVYLSVLLLVTYLCLYIKTCLLQTGDDWGLLYNHCLLIGQFFLLIGMLIDSHILYCIKKSLCNIIIAMVGFKSYVLFPML